VNTTIVTRGNGVSSVVRTGSSVMVQTRGLPGPVGPTGGAGATGPAGDRRLYTTAEFAGDDQARLEAAFEAVANDLADGSPEGSVGVGIVAGQTIYLEEPIITPAMKGGGLYGPGGMWTYGGGHEGEMFDGWLRAAASFTGAALLHVRDWLNGVIQGVNFRYDALDTEPTHNTGIGTESTIGRGTAGLRVSDCTFWRCSRPIWMGQFTASPLLDSDSSFYRLTWTECSGGLTFGHQQSVNHVIRECWANRGGDAVEIVHGGNVLIEQLNTYLQQRLLRVHNIASNGGPVRVRNCRFDGAMQTQLCRMEATVNGSGSFTFEDILDLWDGYSVDTDDPAVVSRSRQVVRLINCDLSRLPETGGGGQLRNRLVSVLNGDNSDRGKVTLINCRLGDATLANNLGAMDTGHTVLTRDCNVRGGASGQAIVDVADATYTGGG